MTQSYTEYVEDLSARCKTLNPAQIQTFCLWCCHRLFAEAHKSDTSAEEAHRISRLLQQLTSVFEGDQPAQTLPALKSAYMHRYLIEDTLENQDLGFHLEEFISAIGNTIDALQNPLAIQSVECGKNIINVIDATLDNANHPVEVDVMFLDDSFRMELETQRAFIQTIKQDVRPQPFAKLSIPKISFWI